MRYEITTLVIKLGTVGRVLPALSLWCGAPNAKGQLLGCFLSENGDNHEVTLLRSFADHGAMQSERWRAMESQDPFGCGEAILSFRHFGYAPFPWMPPIQPGRFGELYEFRTYWVRHGGIPGTMAAWAAAYPERIRYSPLLMVMYALEGEPRFTHIWPYKSFEDRTKIRAETVAKGIWPPKGAPDWLTGQMEKIIALPTPLSPLR